MSRKKNKALIEATALVLSLIRKENAEAEAKEDKEAQERYKNKAVVEVIYGGKLDNPHLCLWDMPAIPSDSESIMVNGERFDLVWGCGKNGLWETRLNAENTVPKDILCIYHDTDAMLRQFIIPDGRIFLREDLFSNSIHITSNLTDYANSKFHGNFISMCRFIEDAKRQ